MPGFAEEDEDGFDGLVVVLEALVEGLLAAGALAVVEGVLVALGAAGVLGVAAEGEAEEACSDFCASWLAFASEVATAPSALATALERPSTPGAAPWYTCEDEAPEPLPEDFACCGLRTCALGEVVVLTLTGAAGVAFGALECPRRATTHTAARTATPARATWKGRESCAIAPSFGISAQEVERRYVAWTVRNGTVTVPMSEELQQRRALGWV
jgi:hypothetical protein